MWCLPSTSWMTTTTTTTPPPPAASRPPPQADYLRYAEYEGKLERLRLLRRRERGITGKKTLSDFAITRRIHFIYERATRKFRGDLGLWMSWLEYCRESRSPKQMSRAVTRALQLHPNKPGLWSYAAAWEFEHNGNPAAARALMQRGLRMNRSSRTLWVEYFRREPKPAFIPTRIGRAFLLPTEGGRLITPDVLHWMRPCRFELLYAQKLRMRRAVLGIEDKGAPAEATDPAADPDAAVQAVLEGAIAQGAPPAI